MAENGSWVGFGGCVWWQEQLQGEARVYSGVGGTAAGVVCCDPAGSSSSAIALLRWSASPTVGKFSEIILSALQTSQVRNSLSASLVTNNNLVSFKGLPRRGSAGESLVSLFHCCLQHACALLWGSGHLHVGQGVGSL